VIILIPTYQRTEILPWVIRSVINCDTQGIDERILILIVNNSPPSRQTVDSIIAQFRFEKNFECRSIHRDKTLPAIESWFSAMFANAEENEVVCLLGDDDIILPWGLKNRYQQIMEQQADMLLSDFYQRIYFYTSGEKCWLAGDFPVRPVDGLSAVPWDYLPAQHPEASFLSNHCYRNTESFRKGFEVAMSWCQAQDWVPVKFATGMLPLYLAYAIQSSCGAVIALHEKDVLRGSVFDEAIIQDHTDGGNGAFFSLLVCDTFANGELHSDLQAFTAMRSMYKRSFVSACLSILSNKNISINLLKKTIHHSGIGFRDFFVREGLSNIYAILREVPWLRGYRLKKKGRSGTLQNTADIIKSLSKL